MPSQYKGKVEQREHGPFLAARQSSVDVGRRNRTSLTKGVEKQMAAVKAALDPDPELKGTEVYGSLCFLDSDWGGLFDSTFSVGSVWIAYPPRAEEEPQEGRPANAGEDGANRPAARRPKSPSGIVLSPGVFDQ